MLTKTENRVARLVAGCYSDKEAADVLNVSVRTIVNHKSNIYEKLGINKATELTNYVIYTSLNMKFDLAEIRKQAMIAMFFGITIFSIFDFDYDVLRSKRSRSGRGKTKRETII